MVTADPFETAPRTSDASSIRQFARRGAPWLMGGALLYLVVRYGTAEVETAFAYGVAWFLLISGIRLALRAAGRPKDVKDAEILAGMTFLFRWVWCLLWLAGTIAALAVGGRILIRSL